MARGPKDVVLALSWIRDAMMYGRFTLSKHFSESLAEDSIDMKDVHHAIANAYGLREYTKNDPMDGGSCWRVFGPNLSGDHDLAIGVEAYPDDENPSVWLVTVFFSHRRREEDEN